jgi:hypothetical protein
VDRASFEGVEKWKRKVEEECGPMTMVLVQNKVRAAARGERAGPCRAEWAPSL